MLKSVSLNESLPYTGLDCDTLTHLIGIIKRILDKTASISLEGPPTTADLEELALLVEDLWTHYRQKGYDCLYAYHDGDDLFEMLKTQYAKNNQQVNSFSLAMLGMYQDESSHESLPLMAHYEAAFEKKYRECVFYAARGDDYREYLYFQEGQRAVELFDAFCQFQRKQQQLQEPSLELVEELLKDSTLSDDDDNTQAQVSLAPSIPPLRFLNKSHDFSESFSPRGDFSSITPRRPDRRNYKPLLIEIESIEEEGSSYSSSQSPRVV